MKIRIIEELKIYNRINEYITELGDEHDAKQYVINEIKEKNK